MRDLKPFRCFDGRFLGRIIAAAVVALVLALVARQFERGSAARIALMGAESAAFGYVIVVTALSIRRLDELNQRIHLVAMGFSFTATAVLATALGMLGKAGLPLGDWYMWAYPFMSFVWIAATLVISRRYR